MNTITGNKGSVLPTTLAEAYGIKMAPIGKGPAVTKTDLIALKTKVDTFNQQAETFNAKTSSGLAQHQLNTISMELDRLIKKFD